MIQPPIRQADKRRILLAEDNAFEARLIIGTLSQLGLRDVIHMRDGESAIASVRADGVPFDLVISDWNMPVRSGLDLLQHVRIVWRHTPFLMVTGHATVEFVKTAKLNAVDAYIVKPFAPHDLISKVSQLIDQR